MKHYGLLGRKLGHSLSPLIHEKLFKLSGLDAEYKLYEYNDIKDFIDSDLNPDGYNVTIPYKEEVMRYLNEKDEKATAIKAVNCVKKCSITSMGFNTDIDGFLESVKEIYDKNDGDVLLLGAGGVAKAVAFALMNNKITIAVRNKSKAEILIEKLGITAEITDFDKIPLREYDLIVNCTPLGMYPEINNIPVDEIVIKHCKAVYDTVYNPLTTKLVGTAKKYGIPAKTGLDMLIYQAVVSHKIWYGAEFGTSDINNLIHKCSVKLKEWY